ncbi:MAG: TetR/AcrR family transcriptional regulator [Paracoccaceae bacterium]
MPQTAPAPEPTKAALRRDDLRSRLIDLAEAQIATAGAASLKARDLATRAGCALGAIYNVFDDMTALVMQVNVRTFARLGDMAIATLAAVTAAPPRAQMTALSLAYLHFAATNLHLWRALFDVSANTPVPDWYRTALADLFAHIEGPIATLFPHLARPQLDLMVRAQFSAVHGIVLLGLNNRTPGAPLTDIEAMITMVMQEIGTQNI